MSPTSFESLKVSHPDLWAALSFLDGWFADHPNVRTFAVDRLATAGRHVPAGQLAEALEVLLEEGLLHEVFQVKDIDGTFLPAEYETLSDVPKRVPDRNHQNFIETAETDVVPVYRLEATADVGR